MAQGDVVFFDDAWEKIHEAMNLETDIFKMGLIKAAGDGGLDPAQADVLPTWSAGGTTNFKAAEVTPGGDYTVDGNECATAVLSQTGGTVTFTTSDPATWVKTSGNPTNASWGILYNDTVADKPCLAYVDLGGSFDMETGDLDIAVHGSGWFIET